MTDKTFAQPAPNAPVWELSGWWRRVGAYLIDSLVIAVLAFVPLAVAYFATGIDFEVLDSDDLAIPKGSEAAYGIFLVVAITIVLLVPTLYYCLMMSRTNGQTVGKQALDIRVVREDGRAVGAQFAFVREMLVINLLFGVLGSFVYIAQAVDFLWPLWDRNNQALHDKIVKSRVVRALPISAGDPLGMQPAAGPGAPPMFPQAPAPAWPTAQPSTAPPTTMPPPPPAPPSGAVPYTPPPPPDFENPVPEDEK